MVSTKINFISWSALILTICLGTHGKLPDKCLKGPFHKDKPSPESDEFLECRSWKSMSCCNVEISKEIHHNNSRGLYDGYDWHKCGQLSDECEQFLKHEECFYQCEPNLAYYARAEKEGYVQGIPICASFCDTWFEACKDDETCVEDWLDDFDYADDGKNHCPAESTCKTFAEMYGDAKGMCDKMWGVAFKHEPSNTNCMVMHFDEDASNPNVNVMPPTSGTSPPQALLFTTVAHLLPYYYLSI